MTARAVSLLVVLSALPCSAWAQAPAGTEFQINSYTPTSQLDPAIASDAAGNFVVAWHSDPTLPVIFAQRYSAGGARLGSEFQVNTTPFGTYAAVASDPSGNFFVAWHNSVGTTQSILGQRFSAAGVPLGAELQLNTFIGGQRTVPVAASDPSGNLLVVWEALQSLDLLQGIVGRRVSAAGIPLGVELRVNTYTPGRQGVPSVTSDASGNFVVVWQSQGQDGSGAGIYAQRYDATGAPVGAEFRVNTHTQDSQTVPSVASDASGNFVVVWASDRQDGGGYLDTAVVGQRFNAAGAPVGAEFQVNTYTTGAQGAPQVASDANGSFIVTWTSAVQDNGSSGVFGQRYTADGARLGAEFQVNTYTTGAQRDPAVAMDRNGNYVVAWESDGQDGSNEGIFGQRFGGLRPAALAVDTIATPNTDGNGVLEPGEFTDARPSWANGSGAAQAIDAAAFSRIAGPQGAFYAIFDPSGDYGTVADGATGPCLDCYGIAVSAPTARPALHWDASVVETISGLQGQTQRWGLHIGDSFTDVPETSGFYRFIETLLHHSVTGGCTATNYCPGFPTSREQMAVFTLVAKQGPGYVPPACVAGSEAFPDVPATSPFCRWIEELARRGVVGGCGSGNYCPASAVTREQMAVFVLRTLDPALAPAPCAPPNLFADVPETSAFCRWIEELANRGVVTGCGGGNYCPTASVTREQMGVFISVTFGLRLYGP